MSRLRLSLGSSLRSSLRSSLGLLLFLCGCSGTYNVRLSDDRSASFGQLFFFGWSDPPLVPGTRLVDAPPGSRLVLWNEAGLEAIVDLGETCPVLIRDGEGARAPTPVELSVLEAVFPGRVFAASPRPAEYADERRLERRFPSHVRGHVGKLDPAAAVEFALGDAPSGWLELGGRAFALARAAATAPAASLVQLLDRALSLEGEERREAVRAILARPELAPVDLERIVRGGAPDLAVAHPAASEAVCLAAVEEVARAPLSSSRRKGLEAILASPGATPKVREKVLEVPLAYPEDRDAIRAKATK